MAWQHPFLQLGGFGRTSPYTRSLLDTLNLCLQGTNARVGSAQPSLEQVAKDLRGPIWKQMSEVGVTLIPNNTFSNEVPDTTAMVGAMPSCYKSTGGDIHHNVYFFMAYGKVSKPAMEMTKWLDSLGGIYISTGI